MYDTPCRLLGELSYPDEYSYERVEAIENEVEPTLQAALADVAVAHLEVSPGSDAYRFEVWCQSCSAEEASAVCEALLPLMEDGPAGRLVVIREAWEPISVLYFAGENLDEVTVEQP